MPSLDLNFQGVGAVPPEDVYTLEIVKAEIRPKKDDKTQQNINLQMKCVDMDDPDFENFTVFENTSVTNPASRWRLQEILEAFTGKDWQDDNMTLDIDDLQGLRAQGVCYHDEYNGRTNLKVRNFMREGESFSGESNSNRVL